MPHPSLQLLHGTSGTGPTRHQPEHADLLGDEAPVLVGLQLHQGIVQLLPHSLQHPGPEGQGVMQPHTECLGLQAPSGAGTAGGAWLGEAPRGRAGAPQRRPYRRRQANGFQGRVALPRAGGQACDMPEGDMDPKAGAGGGPP